MLDRPNVFTGFALSLLEEPVESLEVRADGRALGTYPVRHASPDVAGHLPGVAGSDRCRFRFEISLEPQWSDLTLWASRTHGDPVLLAHYPAGELLRERARFRALGKRLESVALPSSELIADTQGGGDSGAYARSILTGSWKLAKYLEATGLRLGDVGSVLDFGCGTGRLLLSWWLDGRARRLCGCDVNPRLAAWSSRNLPEEIEIVSSELDPPLPWPAESFDLVQCVSVFTHLSSERQRCWIEELRRLLKPGGLLLLTLHGRLYVDLLAGPEERRAFEERGYLELSHGREGSNQFGAFHARRRAEELLEGFELVSFFERGSWGEEPPLFPIAMFQDVYLARKP